MRQNLAKDREFLVSLLTNNKAHVEFHPSLLPNGISINELISYFDFLAPVILIIHSSTISKRKFSTKKNSDFDIVCVSSKAAFWPLSQLYKKLRENLQQERINIDVSIVTSNELISILTGGSSSLRASFDNGFSILYRKEKNWTM